MPACHGDGARIGQLSDLRVVRPCRVDRDAVLQTCAGNERAEDAFGKRRPANVAGAHEEHGSAPAGIEPFAGVD